MRKECSKKALFLQKSKKKLKKSKSSNTLEENSNNQKFKALYSDLKEAIVFNNENVKVEGKIAYAPIYMIMFLEKSDNTPTYYKVDLSGIK